MKFINKDQQNKYNLDDKYTIQFNQEQDINLFQQLDQKQNQPYTQAFFQRENDNNKINDPFQQQNFFLRQQKTNPILVNNYSYFIQHEYVPVHLIFTQDQITNSNLYLGDVSSALDLQFIKNSNIKTVVTAGAQMQQVSFKNNKNQIKHIIYGVLDHKNQNLIQYFDQFYQIVQKSFHKGSILVHCAAGISRSSTLVISYLMKKKIWTFKQAIKFVRSKRPSVLPNLGFQRQLKQYQKILIKQNQRKIKSKTSQSSKHHNMNNNFNNININMSSGNGNSNKFMISSHVNNKNSYNDSKINFNINNNKNKNKNKNLTKQYIPKDFLYQKYQQQQILPQLISISDHRNNRSNNFHQQQHNNNYHQNNQYNNNNIKNLKITQGMGIFINQHNNIYNQYQNQPNQNINDSTSNNQNINQNKFKFKHNMFLNNFYYKNNNKRATGYLNMGGGHHGNNIVGGNINMDMNNVNVNGNNFNNINNNNNGNQYNQHNNRFSNNNAQDLPKNSLKSKSPLPLNNNNFNNNIQGQNNIFNQKNIGMNNNNLQYNNNQYNQQSNQPQINIQITNNVNININNKNLSTKFNNFSQDDLLNGKLSNILSPSMSNHYKNNNIMEQQTTNIPSVLSSQNAKYSLDKNGPNFRSSNYYYNNQNNIGTLSKDKSSNFPIFVNKSQKKQILLSNTNNGLFDSAIIPIKYTNNPGRAQTDSTSRSPFKNNLLQNQKLIIKKIPINNLHALNLNSFNQNNNIRNSLKQKYSNSEIKDTINNSNGPINIQHYSYKIQQLKDNKNSIKFPMKKQIGMKSNNTEEVNQQLQFDQNKSKKNTEKSRNSLINRLKALEGKNMTLKPVQITQILK